MQTIQLNISSDIFDKVISFLELLPRNKIQIIKENSYPSSDNIKLGLAKGKVYYVDNIMDEDKIINEMFYGE